jgi:acetyl esterase/lipase
MAGNKDGNRVAMPNTGWPQFGWLTWGLIVLLTLLAAGYAAFHHAVNVNAVGTLDAADRLLRGGDGTIRLVAAEQYGPDKAQKLEMFVPASAQGRLPVVVFIHGGGWNAGDPHNYRFMARALASHGYAVVLAGYRHFPHVRYPAMLQDGAATLRWVADHAAAHGGDPARVVVMGHSAGAYNAVMLALDKRWLAAVGLNADALRGAVGLSGPYDFYPFDVKASIDSFGQAPDPEDTQPVAHARAGAPPLLLIHGRADRTVKPNNSISLARAMTHAGTPTHAVLLDGVSHEGLIMLFARPFSRDARALDAVLPFLARVTAPASPPVQPPAR